MVLFGAQTGADPPVHHRAAIRTETYGHYRASVIVIAATLLQHSLLPSLAALDPESVRTTRRLSLARGLQPRALPRVPRPRIAPARRRSGARRGSGATSAANERKRVAGASTTRGPLPITTTRSRRSPSQHRSSPRLERAPAAEPEQSGAPRWPEWTEPLEAPVAQARSDGRRQGRLGDRTLRSAKEYVLEQSITH